MGALARGFFRIFFWLTLVDAAPDLEVEDLHLRPESEPHLDHVGLLRFWEDGGGGVRAAGGVGPGALNEGVGAHVCETAVGTKVATFFNIMIYFTFLESNVRINGIS